MVYSHLIHFLMVLVYIYAYLKIYALYYIFQLGWNYKLLRVDNQNSIEKSNLELLELCFWLDDTLHVSQTSQGPGSEIVYITNFIQVSQLSHMIREIFQVWPGETLSGSRD